MTIIARAFLLGLLEMRTNHQLCTAVRMVASIVFCVNNCAMACAKNRYVSIKYPMKCKRCIKRCVVCNTRLDL